MKKVLSFLKILILGVIAIFFSVIVLRHTQEVFKKHKNADLIPGKKQIWLNIFVHGTFGTTTGMLSVPSLLNDEVRGSAYRGVNKGMRDDPVFFQTQPILKRGLHSITPSFDKQEGVENLYAVYPITKAFDEFLRATFHSDFEQKYYTFGWSGLISQYRRRLEAIRFFNALQEEITILRGQGFEPKVRLLAHSHGGNLCLNLGVVHAVLHAKTLNGLHKYFLDPMANESVKKMIEIMKFMGTKEQALAAPDAQKKLDYVPVEKNLCIDELILLGTPIQAETELFFRSPVFKTVYNVYSGQDEVQCIDWVSTRSKESKQRVSDAVLKTNTGINRIVQVKIMYGREVFLSDDKKTLILKSEQQEISFVEKLIGAASGGQDPNHRALWFVGFDRHQNPEKQSFILPLPTSVVMPAIIALISRQQMFDDVDVNIVSQDKLIKFFLTKHEDSKVVESISIHKALFDEIKEKIILWVPSKELSQKEFDAIYRYITHLKLQATKPLQKGL